MDEVERGSELHNAIYTAFAEKSYTLCIHILVRVYIYRPNAPFGHGDVLREPYRPVLNVDYTPIWTYGVYLYRTRHICGSGLSVGSKDWWYDTID